MALDLTLLRLSKDRLRMARLIPGGPPDGLDATTVTLLNAMRKWYKEFPEANRIDLPMFRTWFTEYQSKGIPEDKLALLGTIMDRMKEDVPPELEQGMVERLLSNDLAVQTLGIISRWNEGEEIDLLAEVQHAAEAVGDRMQRKAKLPLVTASPEDLMRLDMNNEGIKFRLSCLSNSMRGLREGDFMILGMRPDAGKTTSACSETTYWYEQMDTFWPGEGRVGVWFNNEGPGDRIKQRWFQSALGATIPEMAQMAQDGVLSKRIMSALNGMPLDRMHFYDVHDFTSGECEGILNQINPGFIVFDMIDNIRFTGELHNGGSRTDQMLEEMYKWGRNQCVKRKCIGLALSQLSADAEGMQFPQQHMLKDSKTGKQGACDLIIMEGKLLDPVMDGSRFIGTPKNKLLLPGHRAPRQEIVFDSDRARLRDPEE